MKKNREISVDTNAISFALRCEITALKAAAYKEVKRVWKTCSTKSTAELAAKFGISHVTAGKWLEQVGKW